jgi:hypothetical protein
MWVTFGYLRPSGHIMLIMEVIEALCTSILEPHDHFHINHARALGRSLHATQITRFGRNAGGQVGDQAVDHIGGYFAASSSAASSRTRCQTAVNRLSSSALPPQPVTNADTARSDGSRSP